MHTIENLNGIFCHLGIKFKLNELIKKSGQRIVYSGDTYNDNQKVVIKICDCTPSGIPRIQRELKILNEIKSQYFPQSIKNLYVSNDNIVSYYESGGIQETNKKYIKKAFFVTVEEYIEHIPWNEASIILKQESNLITFLIEVFKALILLWSLKIAHRDLKPDNILVRPDMTPVIIDLGIAKSFRDGTNNLTNTIFQTPCTPLYASPEQLLDDKNEVGYKSDQFSIGVIAFEIITGKFPYGDIREIGESDLASNMKNSCITDPRHISPCISDEFAFFLIKLLAFQPYKRFRCPEDILTKLIEMKKNNERESI